MRHLHPCKNCGGIELDPTGQAGIVHAIWCPLLPAADRVGRREELTAAYVQAMRTIGKIAVVALALLATSTAAAAPRKSAAKARHAAEERFVVQCVDERTGPTGGISTDDAYELCRAIVKHNHRIDKLAKRASDARSAGAAPRLIARLTAECAEEVSVACEDTTVRSVDGGECSDATLEAKHAFDVCRKAPVAASKEGK